MSREVHRTHLTVSGVLRIVGVDLLGQRPQPDEVDGRLHLVEQREVRGGKCIEGHDARLAAAQREGIDTETGGEGLGVGEGGQPGRPGDGGGDRMADAVDDERTGEPDHGTGGGRELGGGAGGHVHILPRGCDTLSVMGTWWINGELVPSDEATLPIADHGLTVGDGCFETTTMVRGTPFAMRRHLGRLRHSLHGLGIHLATTDDELREAAQMVADANPDHGVLRLTVTAGPGPLGSGRGDSTPSVIIGSSPSRGWPPSAGVVTVPWPRNERGALAGIKSTSYAENVIALAHAKERGASEAIFPNTVGNLCEGTGTNIFVEHEGRLATPPLSSGCLAGVTRALVIESMAVEEIDLPIGVLATTSEAFLTSSTRDVMPIDRIDDRSMTIGPLTEAAMATFADIVADSVDP